MITPSGRTKKLAYQLMLALVSIQGTGPFHEFENVAEIDVKSWHVLEIDRLRWLRS